MDRVSWLANAIVTDGDTDELAAVIEGNNKLYYPQPVPPSMLEQQEFLLEVVQNAFEVEAVEGTYSVNIGGHSNPDQENDRKSLNVSFSPTVLASEHPGYTD